MNRWQEFAAEFVGKLGWLTVPLPAWAIGSYCLLLGLAGVCGASEVRLKAVQRLVLIGVAGLAVISVFVAMWCANTPTSYKELVLHGTGHIPGVQGRYFIPFAFPVMLALSSRRLGVGSKWLLGLAAVIVLVVNGVALVTIRSTYY